MANFKGKKDIIGFLIIIILVGGYFTVSSSFLGLDNRNPLGYTSYPSPSISFIFLIFTNILYIVLGGIGIVFILSFSQTLKLKLLWSIIFIQIIIACVAGVLPLHGRYVDCIFPLLLIGAFYTLRNKNWDISLLTVGFIVAEFSIVFYSALYFDTINSFTNLYTKFTQNTLFILIIVLYITLIILRKRPKILIVTLILLLLTTFTISNIMNFAYVKQSSQNAYETCEIGKWLNENKLHNVSFDEDDYESWWASYCLIQFWYAKSLPLKNESAGFFISSKSLEGRNILLQQSSFHIFEEGNKTLYLYSPL